MPSRTNCLSRHFAGHGLEVSGSTYSNFEAHPNTWLYPSLWRARFEGKTLEVPIDACDEAKQKVGLKYVEIRYFEIDKTYKGMRVLGAVSVPNESTDDNPPGGGYNQHPLSEDHDGWRWHVRKKNDFQLELNADNSVLRAVDFKAKAVLKGGDITGLMSFHFPRYVTSRLCRIFCEGKKKKNIFQSGSVFLTKVWSLTIMLSSPCFQIRKSNAHRGSSIIPGFYPVMHTREDLRHKELLEFFNHKNKFRGNRMIPEVNYNLKFEVVHDIVTDRETFCATILLVEKWQISRLDVADYLACVNRVAWKPLSFDPPAFEVANLAQVQGSIGGRTSSGMQLAYQNERIHLVIEDDLTVVAVRPTRITGYFFNEYHLHNYPFDSQILDVQLKTKRMPRSVCTYAKTERHVRDAKPRVRDTEWMHESENTYHTFEPDTKLADFDVERNIQVKINSGASFKRPLMSTAISGGHAGIVPGEPGRFCLTVKATFKRHYSVHLFRVGFVMALFSLAAVTTMMPHCDSSMERITLLVTLMLTATTYSLVVAESLPTLPYLTLIDKYVLGTFAYFGIIGLELAIIDWTDDFEWPNEDVGGNNTAALRYNFFSSADGSSSYHATFVNLVLWGLFHMIMIVYVWISVRKFNAADKQVLDPHQREVAKNAMENIMANLKPKTKNSADFDLRTAKLMGLTWRNKAKIAAKRNQVGAAKQSLLPETPKPKLFPKHAAPEVLSVLFDDEPGVLEQNKSRRNSTSVDASASMSELRSGSAQTVKDISRAVDSMMDTISLAVHSHHSESDTEEPGIMQLGRKEAPEPAKASSEVKTSG